MRSRRRRGQSSMRTAVARGHPRARSRSARRTSTSFCDAITRAWSARYPASINTSNRHSNTIASSLSSRRCSTVAMRAVCARRWNGTPKHRLVRPGRSTWLAVATRAGEASAHAYRRSGTGDVGPPSQASRSAGGVWHRCRIRSLERLQPKPVLSMCERARIATGCKARVLDDGGGLSGGVCLTKAPWSRRKLERGLLRRAERGRYCGR